MLVINHSIEKVIAHANNRKKKIFKLFIYRFKCNKLVTARLECADTRLLQHADVINKVMYPVRLRY